MEAPDYLGPHLVDFLDRQVATLRVYRDDDPLGLLQRAEAVGAETGDSTDDQSKDVGASLLDDQGFTEHLIPTD